MKRYWLMKSEPDAFSWDQLVATGDEGEPWDGIRNYQARNFMRDDMRVGDLVLFYHSNFKPPHVAGIAEVSALNEPDELQFQPDSSYYDPKSKPEAPRWTCVRIRAVKALPQIVTLADMKAAPALSDMLVNQKGMRLSIQPVDEAHFLEVLRMGGATLP